MGEHDRLLFKLFLMEFWKDFNCAGLKIKNIEDYLHIYNLSSFSMLEECFPDNEINTGDPFMVYDGEYYSYAGANYIEE